MPTLKKVTTAGNTFHRAPRVPLRMNVYEVAENVVVMRGTRLALIGETALSGSVKELVEMTRGSFDTG